jgi:hypothetical protein
MHKRPHHGAFREIVVHVEDDGREMLRIDVLKITQLFARASTILVREMELAQQTTQHRLKSPRSVRCRQPSRSDRHNVLRGVDTRRVAA